MAFDGRPGITGSGAGTGQHQVEESAMSIANPHFAEPQWLWLAFLGPVLLGALQLYSGWARRKQLAQIAAPHFLAQLTRSHSPWRRGIKNGLLIVAVAAIGFTLARPQ